ncbi:MAG: transporter substrate-binding domain-containing protein [Anaerolineae bacterium]|nr:transporter substrate-binding domain-containing protein [Anaerolineae bacterium]
MKRLFILLIIACTATMAMSACAAPPAAAPTSAPPSAPPSAPQPAQPTAAPVGSEKDLLDIILERGVMRVSTDANYAPQSYFDEKTKTWTGFDIEVAYEVGRRLGVKVEFVTPDWSAVTAGNWAGRWDVSIGSMTITPERQKVLDFTPPYYYTAGQFGVRADLKESIKGLDDLEGKTVCVGEATVYEQYLNGTLDIEGEVLPPPKNVKVATVKTDLECIQSMQSGRKDYDAVLTASNVLADAIKKGAPVVAIGSTVFADRVGISIDKAARPNAKFLAALSKIVEDMHADGTLSAISKKYYDGFDLTKLTK